MSSPSFISYFGYGSLVNLATLRTKYLSAHPAVLQGWRRVWLARPAHAHSFGTDVDLAFLSVERMQTSKINGMVIVDHAANLDALDRREVLYERLEISTDEVTLEQPESSVFGDMHYLYIAQDDGEKSQHLHILRSYLDAVLQGFFDHWGEPGIADFKSTTRNCHFAILEDRDQPIYPRHVTLNAAARHAVEQHFPVKR
ncbi:MAG: gamma-glutamylcyclotransferase [Hyphomicrobiales bacterium]|nr:MAG: gamma-glutamylcyclotransferase [Hyphomicrobiales bacterium]